MTIRRPLVCITIIYLSVITVLYLAFGINLNRDSVLIDNAGSFRTVTGEVTSVTETGEDSCRLVVSVNEVNITPGDIASGSDSAGNVDNSEKSPNNELILINVYGDPTLPADFKGYPDLAGRTIRAGVSVEKPSGRRNPATFDYSLYLKTRKIYVTGTCNANQLMASDVVTNKFRNRLAILRHEFINRIDSSTGPIVSAIFFGDKSRVDEETYDAFQKNGTAHVLAVSGLHIGIIYSFINMLWKWHRRFLYSMVMILFLFSYAALADFSPSVMRAFIMIALHIISKLIHKRYDMLTAAAVSALAMTINNPMQIFNSGFILSFGAIAVLSVLIPVLPKGKKGAILLPLILQAVMLPYTAYNFNYVSVIGFILNFPVIFIANMILPIGVVLLLFTSFGFMNPLSDIGFALLKTITEILVKMNEATCIQGATTFNVASPSIFFIVLFYGLFFLFMSEFFRIFFLRREKSRMKKGIAAVLILSLLAFAVSDRSFRKCELVFVDVGQGDCIHLKCGSRNYLFDSGGKKDFNLGRKTLEPYLLKNGVSKLTGAFITHAHTDHFDGLKQLSQDYNVENIFFSKNYFSIRKSLEKSAEASNYFYLNSSNTLSLGNDCNLKILWPVGSISEPDIEDENANSMIMKLSCHGVSVLITGDIDSECEKQIADYYKGTNLLKCDILKIAHHGSHYSSCDEFLDATDPDIAVIQVGKNNYGHPSGEVLEKLKQRGIRILRNDVSGAIGFKLKNGGISSAVTMIDEYSKSQ